MIELIAHDATGRVLFYCTRADGMTPMPFDGRIYRRCPPEFSKSPPTPTSVAFCFGPSPEWVETATLDEARAIAWAAAKNARDAAESADFEFDGTLYQPDVSKITGAVLAALLPIQPPLAPFSINWTVADNSVVTLDALQVMALGRTLSTRIDAIHQYGRELRALIDNATTPAEAYGHTWNMNDGE